MPTSPTSIGAWLNTPEPIVADAVARGGFDWVCIDEQHGTSTTASTPLQVAAITAAGAASVVRVAWNRPELIGRAIDVGASAVIVPMVQSVAEAESAASSARYAPHGTRSWGPGRRAFSVITYDAVEANTQIGVHVMIETVDALAAVAEIAAVPGVDGIFVGPFDLSLALGTTVDDLLSDPASQLNAVVAACEANDKIAGAYAGSLARAARFRELGFTMLALAADTDLIATAAADALTSAREQLR